MVFGSLPIPVEKGEHNSKDLTSVPDPTPKNDKNPISKSRQSGPQHSAILYPRFNNGITTFGGSKQAFLAVNEGLTGQPPGNKPSRVPVCARQKAPHSETATPANIPICGITNTTQDTWRPDTVKSTQRKRQFENASRWR
jgi:hypothetical protein